MGKNLNRGKGPSGDPMGNPMSNELDDSKMVDNSQNNMGSSA